MIDLTRGNLLDGLRWEQVRPLIEQRLGDLDARVLLYEPQASQR